MASQFNITSSSLSQSENIALTGNIDNNEVVVDPSKGALFGRRKKMALNLTPLVMQSQISAIVPVEKPILIVEKVLDPNISFLREVDDRIQQVFTDAWRAGTAKRLESCLNGNYLLSQDSRNLILFKPLDEELGADRCPHRFQDAQQSKWGVKIGTQGYRESIGFLLDTSIRAGVPPTAMMTLSSPEFNGGHAKRGSAQLFIPNSRNLMQIESGTLRDILRHASPSALQKLFLFDLVSCNADRNRGNLLIDERGDFVLIDHGCILPSGFVDEGHFTWLGWEIDALHQPFTREIQQIIQSLNHETFEKQILDEFSEFPNDSLNTLKYSLMAVKMGAELELSPFLIASLFVYPCEQIPQSAMRLISEFAKTQEKPDSTFSELLQLAAKTIRSTQSTDIRDIAEAIQKTLSEEISIRSMQTAPKQNVLAITDLH